MPGSVLAFTRRGLLASVGLVLGGALLPARGAALIAAAAQEAPPVDDGPFDRSVVTDFARKLAAAPYAPVPADLPDVLKNLTYDQYRDIRFRPAAATWAGENLPFQLQFFHPGFYFKEPVQIAIVSDQQAHHLAYSQEMFDFGPLVPRPIPPGDFGFAGFRVHTPLNRPDYFDEVAVFQGASYFRALGKGEVYGLSARGLAVKTAEPEGEEFPIFRNFWVERPNADTNALIIHAVLDSPSVSGAYRFTLRPGLPTVMDVEATLFPRVDLVKVGLAPGTSMFFFDANGRHGVDDYRPEVHDSDGLLILNGRGERLWRPLANPQTLQISAFVDAAPRGFGLMQRNRSFHAYEDIEAAYERRPSLWVEPVGDWGQGAVILVEIPTDSEINDNIVAYWQPKDPIKAGSEYSFAYRLYWGNPPASASGGLVVASTRSGRATLRGDSPIRFFVVEFTGDDGKPLQPSDPPKATVTTSAGTLSEVHVVANPINGAWRLTFKLDPGDATLIELRAVLTFPDQRPVETWVYRWTA